MSKHVLTGLVVCLLAVLLIIFTAVPALAFDARSGDTVTVASGEVVDGDLYVAGGNIIIDGAVNGDIFGVGQSLTINGSVDGGVSFVGQRMTVNGDIAHGARLAGQTISVSGNIGRDLVAAGVDVIVTSTARIGSDLILAGGTARIDGRINGDIRGSADTVTVADGVGGEVELGIDKLTITSAANIQGNLTYTSDNKANIQSGAKVGGTTIHKLPEVKKPARFFAAGLASKTIGKVLGFLMIFVIGIIIIYAATRRITSMAGSIRTNPWQSLGWGALILFATPVAAIIVIATVIGLPVGLIALALYGIAIYLSQIPVALLIGRLIIRQSRELESKGLMVGALALGLAILLILSLIPFVGWLVWLFTAMFGLGTLVTSVRRFRAETP